MGISEIYDPAFVTIHSNGRELPDRMTLARAFNYQIDDASIVVDQLRQQFCHPVDAPDGVSLRSLLSPFPALILAVLVASSDRFVDAVIASSMLGRDVGPDSFKVGVCKIRKAIPSLGEQIETIPARQTGRAADGVAYAFRRNQHNCIALIVHRPT